MHDTDEEDSLPLQHHFLDLHQFCEDVLPNLALVELIGRCRTQIDAGVRLGLSPQNVYSKLRSSEEGFLDGRRLIEEKGAAQDGPLTPLGKDLRKLARQILPHIDSFISAHLVPQRQITVATVRSFWLTYGSSLEQEFKTRMPNGILMHSPAEGRTNLVPLVGDNTFDVGILTFPFPGYEKNPKPPLIRHHWRDEQMALVVAKRRARQFLKDVKLVEPRHLFNLHRTFVAMHEQAPMFTAVQKWIMKNDMAFQFKQHIRANSIPEAVAHISSDAGISLLPAPAIDTSRHEVEVIPLKDDRFVRPLYVLFRHDNVNKKEAIVALLDCFFPEKGSAIFDSGRQRPKRKVRRV